MAEQNLEKEHEKIFRTSIPTVRVASEKGPNGYVLINQSDFDPKKHTLWENVNKPTQVGPGLVGGNKPQGSTTKTPFTIPEGFPGSGKVFPLDFDTWKKADIQEWASNELAANVDPDKLTQPQMVEEVKAIIGFPKE